MHAVRPFLFLVMLLTLTGCRERRVVSDRGVVRELVSFAGSQFDTVTLDPTQADLNLFWRRPDGSRYGNFTALQTGLRKTGRGLIFATNAGIFDPSFTPVGLHVEQGREIVPLNLKSGSGNFYLKPNGVFLVDSDGPKVIQSERYAGTRADVRLATQSGTLLVRDGAINVHFQPQSVNKRIRSGVGVRADHHIGFALSREPVTFYAFARLFRDRLGCANALYLDGAISRFYFGSDVSPGASEEGFAGMLAVTSRE